MAALTLRTVIPVGNSFAEKEASVGTSMVRDAVGLIRDPSVRQALRPGVDQRLEQFYSAVVMEMMELVKQVCGDSVIDNTGADVNHL